MRTMDGKAETVTAKNGRVLCELRASLQDAGGQRLGHVFELAHRLEGVYGAPETAEGIRDLIGAVFALEDGTEQAHFAELIEL